MLSWVSLTAINDRPNTPIIFMVIDYYSQHPARATPALLAHTSPVIIANHTDPIQTKSSSKRVAANAPQGSIDLATTVNASAALIRKPCPGRVVVNVQRVGGSLGAIV
jgi:hypothetical protein